MKKQPLISIIVPVYKVEKYLDKCVSSIVNQTYENLEIILIDDGSPDRSGEICDAWAQKDTRIKVIHQENAGGGPARNAALDVAQGDFVAMVDSDDYIERHMYEHLLHYMSDDVDIVECEIAKTYGDEAVLDDGAGAVSKMYPVQEALRLHIADTLFCQTPPNKLYRWDVVADVRFPKGTGIDDEYWTYRAIGNSRNLVHTTSVMYAYRQQSSSIMHSLDVLRRLRAVEAKVQRHEYLGEKYPELQRDSLKNLWFTCLYQGQLIYRQKNSADTQKAIAYLHTVMRKYPPSMDGCTFMEKLWLTMARTSFTATCRIRNLMKIGL